MKTNDLQKAIEIVSKSNSIKVAFNVPVNDNYSNVYDVLILESNATVIKQLYFAGFSLFMTPKGLAIDKI